MRKLCVLLILFLLFVMPYSVSAIQRPINDMGYDFCYTGYKYINGGGIYSDVNMPYITGKSINLYEEKNVKGKIVPVSAKAKNEKLSIETLKRGTSQRTNYMFVVEVGDAGILKAAQNGGISKIHFIEVTKEKLYVPLVFIPVYFDRFITTVYGE